jgi:putative ABC transport system permease protein
LGGNWLNRELWDDGIRGLKNLKIRNQKLAFMLKSYFKVAWRTIRKNRLYSFINIAGLTVGITSCILIGLYVFNELSYDSFNKNAERIVRVTMEYKSGGTVNKTAVTGTKTGPQFKRTFPAVEAFARIIKEKRTIAYADKVFNENNVLYADSPFFQIFSFKLLQGNARTALSSLDNIVITKSTAKKYFGNGTDSYGDAIGKTLRVADTKDFVVSGVADDVPENSQIKFDFIIPFGNQGLARQEEQWWTANFVTYLLLQQPSQIASLQQQITQYMRGVTKDELKMEDNDYLTYHLEPLRKVHLHSSLDGLEPNGDITYVYVLSIISILILIIACVNYTNLATAQAAGRGTEVGIRKVLGALQTQLFSRFLGESFILTLIALILSVIISIMLLPAFNAVAGKALTAASLLKPLPIISLLLLCILISFFAGIYPAFILSNSKLANILKSGFRLSSSGSGLRKSLIVFQFVISVFLVITTLVVVQQLSYIQHKQLGYDKDHLIVLPVDNKISENYDAIKTAIALTPGVVSVSGGYDVPTFIAWGDEITAETGTGKKSLSVTANPVDLDYIKTLGMQIIAGEDFTKADMLSFDTSGNNKNYRNTYIINEKAARELGWSPEQAVGKTIVKGAPGTIKAVVKDFHYSSLHQPIGPFVIFLGPNQVRQMFVKILGKDIPATLQRLSNVWKERIMHRPFEYRFLDEDYNSLYTAEQQTATVFALFAGLAIALACLGLFALAAYTTAQRTKEIGIRKVLGAGIGDITFLVSKEFIQLVLIAIIIASPLALIAATRWLHDFAYRININWWIFVVAGLLAVVIAIITVSSQAIKAAIANPVKSLRTE